MNRLSRYCFYTATFLMPAFLFSSCKSTKTATVAHNAAPVTAKPLTDEQKDELTSTFFEADKEKILGNYDRAMALFYHCLSIDPYNAAANFELGNILANSKQPDSAIVYAERAAKVEPSNVWYQELYAQCLEDKGRYKEMMAVYEGLIKEHPYAIDYYYKLALAQIEDGQFEKAAGTYDIIEQMEGGFSEEITKEKIKIYEKTRNYPKAEQQVQRLINHDSTVVRYYDMLGDLYEIEGKSDKAFELYKKMEQKYPDDPSIRLSLASYYRDRHDDKKSFEELEAAFKISTMDVESKVRILMSFYAASTGHDSLQIQGVALCDAMVQAHPKNPTAHAVYGDFLTRQNSYKEAREQYRMALSEDSSKFINWSHVMQMDVQLNDATDLVNVSAGAIELFPDHPEPYLLNGIGNNLEKKYEAAVSSLRKGIDYVVNNNALLAQFYATLGDIYNSGKNYYSSDSAYEAALKIDPNNDYVLNNYSYFLSVRDTNLARAEQMSKKANMLSVNNYTYEDTYAWILYREGKYAEAKEWEDKALANKGDKDATILDHYGDIMFKLGDKEKAIGYWKKAKDGGMKSELLNRKINDGQLYEK